MINQPEAQDPLDEEREVVEKFLGHLAAPCGDMAGRNLRDFYIREGKRMLEKNAVTDPDLRQELDAAIRFAEKLRDAENA